MVSSDFNYVLTGLKEEERRKNVGGRKLKDKEKFNMDGISPQMWEKLTIKIFEGLWWQDVANILKSWVES